MTPENKVLLVDSLLAILAVGAGLPPFEFDYRWWAFLLFGAFAAVVATLQYYIDRDTFGSWIAELAAVVVVVGVPTLVVSYVATTHPASADALRFVTLTGLGAGILTNRIVYGVIRPIPESRLARARDGAW